MLNSIHYYYSIGNEKIQEDFKQRNEVAKALFEIKHGQIVRVIVLKNMS